MVVRGCGNCDDDDGGGDGGDTGRSDDGSGGHGDDDGGGDDGGCAICCQSQPNMFSTPRSWVDQRPRSFWRRRPSEVDSTLSINPNLGTFSPFLALAGGRSKCRCAREEKWPKTT